MTDTQSQSKPEWKIVEAGALAWTGTSYVIRWTGLGSFVVEWKGSPIAAAGAIQGAKDHAVWHSRQMIEMGLEF